MCLWIWSSEPPFRHSHTFVASSSGHGLRLSCLVLDFLACPMRLVVPTERAEGSNDGKASSSIQWRECLFLVCQIRGRPSEWLYSHAFSVLDRVLCVCVCVPSGVEQIARKWFLFQGVAHSGRVLAFRSHQFDSASRRVSALGHFWRFYASLKIHQNVRCHFLQTVSANGTPRKYRGTLKLGLVPLCK